jgi:hypothetical protein
MLRSASGHRQHSTAQHTKHGHLAPTYRKHRRHAPRPCMLSVHPFFACCNCPIVRGRPAVHQQRPACNTHGDRRLYSNRTQCGLPSTHLRWVAWLPAASWRGASCTAAQSGPSHAGTCGVGAGNVAQHIMSHSGFTCCMLPHARLHTRMQMLSKCVSQCSKHFSTLLNPSPPPQHTMPTLKTLPFPPTPPHPNSTHHRT